MSIFSVAEIKLTGNAPARAKKREKATPLDKLVILYYNNELASELGAWSFS
jgi:hypothetical protein